MLAHLDIDAFFAAVEMHRRPELRGRPVIVGGDPDGRGVVATANYAARRFGIRSAMSAAEARRRCPHAAFVFPDIAEYRQWSARVWELVREHSDVVEVVGLDEGYLELDPERWADHARTIQRAVARKVRLSCALGVATSKVVAKIASDQQKPGGLVVVPAGTEAGFLAPLPIRALPGAGPRTEARLRVAGLARIGDIAGLSDASLAQVLPGNWGRELRERASGIDRRPVSSEQAERVSVSTERTFAEDQTDPTELARRSREMAAVVAELLRRRDRAARTVTLKLRYSDFTTVTRGLTLAAATDDAPSLGAIAAALLAKALAERDDPVRLLGVGMSGLEDEYQLALFSPEEARTLGA